MKLFDKLLFANEKECEEFAFYLSQRGLYLYKQVYDILSEDRIEITYQEFSSIIRYDKALRYKIYEYLSLFEEHWRNRLLTEYDVLSPNGGPYKQHRGDISQDLCSNEDKSFSNLFYRLELDLGKLMDICIEKNLANIPPNELKQLKELRNHTMHHIMLLFGHAHNRQEAIIHCGQLEKQINVLFNHLPQEYQNGFIKAINKLNGTETQYLSRFYLEATNDGIRIKK